MYLCLSVYLSVFVLVCIRQTVFLCLQVCVLCVCVCVCACMCVHVRVCVVRVCVFISRVTYSKMM